MSSLRWINIVGVLIFLLTLNNSFNLGTPDVALTAASVPDTWKESKVIWVPISPIVCAATIPTISPGCAIDCLKYLVILSIT